MRSTRGSNKNVREFALGDKWVISIMNLKESIASRIVRKPLRIHALLIWRSYAYHTQIAADYFLHIRGRSSSIYYDGVHTCTHIYGHVQSEHVCITLSVTFRQFSCGKALNKWIFRHSQGQNVFDILRYIVFRRNQTLHKLVFSSPQVPAIQQTKSYYLAMKSVYLVTIGAPDVMSVILMTPSSPLVKRRWPSKNSKKKHLLHVFRN